MDKLKVVQFWGFEDSVPSKPLKRGVILHAIWYSMEKLNKRGRERKRENPKLCYCKEGRVKGEFWYMTWF